MPFSETVLRVVDDIVRQWQANLNLQLGMKMNKMAITDLKYSFWMDIDISPIGP